MSTGFSLKDHLFHRERVEYLAGLFANADPRFDARGFVRDTMRDFQPLELKQRIAKITTSLETFLPNDFKLAAKAIVQALPPPLDPTRQDDDFGDFIFAPLGLYVVRCGSDKRHVSLALKTLQQITMRFSMEDAIRHFINNHPEATLRELDKWATHRNYHVRRLVSEGTRPLLPWSCRLSLPVDIPIGLLDQLHADPTRYVTRSVANHLNDLAKSHPDLVLQTLARWRAIARQREAELSWMERHALRTLVKRGHPRALEFLGFDGRAKIEISGFTLAPSVVVPGDAIEFSFELTALHDARLMLDYVIDFVKAGGKWAPKVFKLKQVEMRAGQRLKIVKRHPLRANATTFSLYPGMHRVTLQINGRESGSLPFELLTRKP